MTEPTATDISTDTEYQDTRILTVHKQKGGWMIGTDYASSWLDAKHGVTPKVGDLARFYPSAEIGAMVRGLCLNGRLVFYKTAAEQHEEVRQTLDAMDQRRRMQADRESGETARRIAAIPLSFKLRLARFRANDPDFWWRAEFYELFICEQALLLAETLKTVRAIRAFHDASNEGQKEQVPALSNQHTGYTFNAACALAIAYLKGAAL